MLDNSVLAGEIIRHGAYVCDVAKNPEWTFVREGPTWHDRRVATWQALMGV
jgi:hypothetical protein